MSPCTRSRSDDNRTPADTPRCEGKDYAATCLLPVAPINLDLVCLPRDDPKESIWSGGREVRLRTCTPGSVQHGAGAHVPMMLTVMEPAMPNDPPTEVIKGVRVRAAAPRGKGVDSESVMK